MSSVRQLDTTGAGLAQIRPKRLKLTLNAKLQHRFDDVDGQTVNTILSSLPTPMTAVEQEHNLWFISSEQTKLYENEGDEKLF